ncbi:MAG: hypothetical protein M3416_06475 [Acidobacteriota bacterium]|nr:hypothetical protein [Acidobacteriota bacterium]
MLLTYLHLPPLLEVLAALGVALLLIGAPVALLIYFLIDYSRRRSGKADGKPRDGMK